MNFTKRDQISLFYFSKKKRQNFTESQKIFFCDFIVNSRDFLNFNVLYIFRIKNMATKGEKKENFMINFMLGGVAGGISKVSIFLVNNFLRKIL